MCNGFQHKFHKLLLTVIAFLKTLSPTMSASILSTVAPYRVNKKNMCMSGLFDTDSMATCASVLQTLTNYLTVRYTIKHLSDLRSSLHIFLWRTERMG